MARRARTADLPFIGTLDRGSRDLNKQLAEALRGAIRRRDLRGGEGNIVVVPISNSDVLTFSPDGNVVKTEKAVQPGNGGIVVMPDGTKSVSSVREGGVSRIRPNQAAELIAQNIPNPASMCCDAGANRLVIPMNATDWRSFH